MLFHRSKSAYVGVDIGSVGLKVVEFSAAGRVPELATYGLAEFPTNGLRADDDAFVGALARTINTVAKRAQVRARVAMASVPTHLVFTSVISVPHVSRTELPLAIEREARKIVPLPLETMRLESKVLEARGPAGEMKVLLTGTAKAVVERYQKIFGQTKFKLLSLEPEVFSLIRVLLGRDQTSSALIDVGASSTDIFIVENGVPYIHRSLASGGRAVTDLMAKGLRISAAEAEQLKRDFSLASWGAPARALVPEVMRTALTPIVNEVRYTAAIFQEQTGRRVEKVILSGGLALLPGLTQTISQTLGVRVYLGNPWARVRYPLELKTILEESAGRYAVAVGLAMRDIVR